MEGTATAIVFLLLCSARFAALDVVFVCSIQVSYAGGIFIEGFHLDKKGRVCVPPKVRPEWRSIKVVGGGDVLAVAAVTAAAAAGQDTSDDLQAT